MSMRKTGLLTEVDRKNLVNIHIQALRIAEIATQRLAQVVDDQRDAHINSWWRHLDDKLEDASLSINYEIEKFQNVVDLNEEE